MPRVAQVALLWLNILPLAFGQAPIDVTGFQQFVRRLVGDTQTPRWRMTLTYLPSFHPESQIVLSELSGTEGTATVTTFQKSARALLNDRRSINSQLDIERFKSDTGFSVKLLAIPVPKLRKWLDDAARQIPGSMSTLQRRTEVLPTGEVLVQLDGTLYCFEFEVGNERLSSAISGAEVDSGDRGSDPQLVRFMRSLRNELVKLARGEK